MISIPIIITLAVLAVLALTAPLFSPFRRSVKEEEPSADGEALPPVSIVIAEHDCSYYLEHVLPRYLSQDYPAGFQLVVVIDQGDTKSEDYLKILCDKDERLYYTLLPDSSRYVSRKKLGLTLGIRAARHEWVMIADADCYPSSDQWLRSVARHATDDKNMVLGVTQYDEDSPKYYRFEQLRTMLYHLHQAQSGQPFSTNQSALMLRRSEFFDSRGFYGNLEFARAEHEFMVNKFGKEDKCALAIEPEARMVQLEPSGEYWRMKRLYALDALKGLQRAGKFKAAFKFDMWMMHAHNLLTLVVLAIGGLLTAMQFQGDPTVGDIQFKAVSFSCSGVQYSSGIYDGILLLAGGCLLWLISLVIRCSIYSRQLNYFDTGISSISAVIMEWGITLRNAILRIQYIFADKNDFITHKL